MPTTPSLSRQTSRTGRHHYRSTDPEHPSRKSSRPGIDRRDSSPMRTLATMGLLAGQAAIGAALPLARPNDVQASAGPSRMVEDNMRAWEIARRDVGDSIDWNAVDYSQVDWSQVDFSGGAAAYSPSIYSTPGPSPTSQAMAQPTPATPAPVQRAQAQSPIVANGSGVPADKDLFQGIAPEQNAIAIVWRGQEPATFHAYANAGPYQPGLGDPYNVVVVQPGGHAVLQFPEGWSGRVQLMGGPNGRADDPSTWAEVTFNAWQNLLYMDISSIRGVNCGLNMRASDGSTEMHIPTDIVQRAPDSVKVQDSTGAWVIRDTEGYDGVLHQDVVDYLKTVTDTTQTYMRHDDDLATHATRDAHVVFEFSR